MENVILIVHLLLALALIGVVLLQRSEGGGLGMGGGGGGAMSQRAAATALGKITWGLAIAFIITSITLTVLAASDASGTSVMDRLTGGSSAEESDGSAPAPLDTDGLLPPPSGDTGTDSGADAPMVPSAD
ncbi:preprotein translocase subunit SecG [Salipiger sp. PrR002]|uniref:preprotein translocase subunit SecG n=1 Tax=Salipiger sp. PrR002 TaxID=2706489 RepID=UPI0013BE5E32|nr:preprotein translocase subunit SecG [Salipiger sp. PrR002]NDV98681.1 preprotein translocase subunit SecG [Salipiger sp. PrR002]NDW57517.1 preprotein translocase subunit SecG [Salipiger sp. PrR004]